MQSECKRPREFVHNPASSTRNYKHPHHVQTHPHRLLVRALHARLPLILVHRFIPLRAIALPRVDVVKINLVQDDVAGILINRLTGRKSLLEQGDVFDGYVVGPCDGELDIQIAEIVVSLRRHTLAVDDLEVV